jgi:hypothetical protein
MLSAQPVRMTPQERVDKMTKDLSLTKDQQTKALAIFTKSSESMRKLFEENQGDFEAVRPAMQKVRQETDDQLKKVLTKDQYEKYAKERASQRPPGQ